MEKCTVGIEIYMFRKSGSIFPPNAMLFPSRRPVLPAIIEQDPILLSLQVED